MRVIYFCVTLCILYYLFISFAFQEMYIVDELPNYRDNKAISERCRKTISNRSTLHWALNESPEFEEERRNLSQQTFCEYLSTYENKDFNCRVRDIETAKKEKDDYGGFVFFPETGYLAIYIPPKEVRENLPQFKDVIDECPQWK